MEVLHSTAPLIVYVDVKSPYALVAIGPTLALEEELGLAFDWRPLTLNIPSYLGSARKSEGKVSRIFNITLNAVVFTDIILLPSRRLPLPVKLRKVTPT